MQREQLKLEDMDVNWDRVEEEDRPLLIRVITRLRKDLEALKRLSEGEVPTFATTDSHEASVRLLGRRC